MIVPRRTVSGPPPEAPKKKGASQIFRTRRISALAFCLLAIVLLTFCAGCWPLDRGPTPQQKFFDQLNRGDAVAANQTWLAMSPEDREKLQRGEGVRQRPSREQIKAALERHQAADTTPVTVGAGQNLPAAEWQNLPQILNATPTPSRSPDTSGH